MGVNLKDLIPPEAKRQAEFSEFKGKVFAIDAYNALYQFLSAIRQADGTPLMDSRGRVTSHLSGLFYRTINFIEMGLKPAYVFDGKPPEIKAAELARRTRVKEEAAKKYEEAIRRGDLEAARRYAQMMSKLTDEMVEAAKKLLYYMGIPCIQAPGEGEAQAAYITIRGDSWATASQDYDSLLFGSPRLVRNLTISGKRKLPRKNVYIEVKPEIVELDKVLKYLGVTRSQLIDIAILIGTDYNPEGVRGVGPKRALTLIKTHGSLEKVIPLLKAEFPEDPIKIREYFLNPTVTDNYKIEWSEPDEKCLVDFLCGEYDFSKSRVNHAIERLKKAYRENIKVKQMGLDAWFS